jgi:hypothetical protein
MLSAMPPSTAAGLCGHERPSSPTVFSHDLSQAARFSCVKKACTSLILDKGKPVARPGRKAKGRRLVAGSLAAERMMLFSRVGVWGT